MKYNKCNKCNLYLDEKMDVCPRCGNILSEKLDQQVGNQFIETAAECLENRKSKKSKGIAFILCFFFGWVGFHYFYVGRTSMGILYLFTFGFFGIGWFVDMVRIFVNSFQDADGNYLE